MALSAGASNATASESVNWTSRFAFLMASVGFAVGLGNIWRFPYVTGENGGGAFVIIYLLCAFGIGMPMLMAELVIGRRGKMSPANAILNVAREEKRSERWRYLGHMNVFAAFLIMIVYSVIAGWVLNYLYKALTTGFVGVDGAAATQQFEMMLADPLTMLFWTVLGMVLTGAIIYAGLEKGIERAVKILMPLLFVLLLILVAYNTILGGFGAALNYLFSPDFSKITPAVILAAVGQAFFSIGVGMAAMMTYGAYLPKQVSIPRSVALIVCVDTVVALLAGLVIFPAVFANGLDPSGGPGLIFQTLPVAFAQMPGGQWVSVLFFLLLSVAAITSMVGLIEPQTRWLQEAKGYARHKSALVILSVISLLSVLSILGYNHFANYTYLGMDINGAMDYVANQLLLPIGGLLIAVFVAWVMRREVVLDELGSQDGLGFRLWYGLIRYVVPVALLVMFLLGVSE